MSKALSANDRLAEKTRMFVIKSGTSRLPSAQESRLSTSSLAT